MVMARWWVVVIDMVMTMLVEKLMFYADPEGK